MQSGRPPSTTTRREALAVLGAAALGTGAFPARGDSESVPARPIPLRAVRHSAKITPDATEAADTLRFEGLGPAPILRVRQGEPVAFDLTNETDAPLSLHLHGVRGPNAADGVAGLTGPAVPPGAAGEVRLTPPDPGTYLIRPGMLSRAGEASGRGLAALLIVQEREPPRVDADIPLLVRDWLTVASGALAPFEPSPAAMAPLGRLGNRIVVNGADAPHRAELSPGARVRLRLANACNARATRIRFEGAKVFVAAVDGQPTETFEPLRSTLPFPPGARYDMLLDMPPEPGGTVSVTALLGTGLPLVMLTSAGAARPPRSEPIPALPPNRALPPEIRLQNAARRMVVLAGGPQRGSNGQAVPGGPWTVNGAAGSIAGPPLLSVKRGQPVVLGITNQTAVPQPLHLHGHVFRLLHPLDDGWEPYWLDTFQAPEGRTTHIAFLADNPGRWLLGSSALERRDAGLWTWFEVT